MNPKAETVEDLQRRRKGLHLGMCKLLREDLSIMADQRAAVANDQQVHVNLSRATSNLAVRTHPQVSISILMKQDAQTRFRDIAHVNLALYKVVKVW